MRYFEIDDTKQFMSALLAKDVFRDFELSSAQVVTFMTFRLDGLMHPDFFSDDTMPEMIARAGDGSAGTGKKHPDGDGREQGTQPETERASAPACPDQLTPWPLAAPVISSLIRGKNPPLSMKLVLRLADSHVRKLTAGEALPFSLSDVSGLFLNINYENGKVSATTGTSFHVFTLDRTLDTLWDRAVEKFLNLIG